MDDVTKLRLGKLPLYLFQLPETYRELLHGLCTGRVPDPASIDEITRKPLKFVMHRRLCSFEKKRFRLKRLINGAIMAALSFYESYNVV